MKLTPAQKLRKKNQPDKAVKSFSLSELSKLLGAELSGDGARQISGVNALNLAVENEASFLANPRYGEAMKESRAGVICVGRQTALIDGKNFLVSDDPSRLFQQIAELFYSVVNSAFTGIHPTAVVHSSAWIGQNVSIGPYSVIDADAKIGSRSKIGAHVFIGAGVEIGEECRIDPMCSVREGCHLGHRVILQSGSIIGSCGFGYTTDKTGRHQKIQHLGTVVIEDDVEIGANTTIDRSRFDQTVVGQGSKIDNLVQIAHNVRIGPHNLIAAQSGVAGSSQTGRHVVLGGQVGVAGHLALDDQVMVAAQSGISKSLKTGKYRGSPAIPISEYNRQEVYVRRLEEYAAKIKDLENRLADLEKRFSH